MPGAVIRYSAVYRTKNRLLQPICADLSSPANSSFGEYHTADIILKQWQMTHWSTCIFVLAVGCHCNQQRITSHHMVHRRTQLNGCARTVSSWRAELLKLKLVLCCQIYKEYEICLDRKFIGALCPKNYQNRERFDKTIAKNKTV